MLIFIWINFFFFFIRIIFFFEFVFKKSSQIILCIKVLLVLYRDKGITEELKV
jgi:hypothetical protein